jgi:hypothetical protein
MQRKPSCRKWQNELMILSLANYLLYCSVEFFAALVNAKLPSDLFEPFGLLFVS